ncbi:RlmE family RNA methyltransferase [Thermaurantiacus sp.]
MPATHRGGRDGRRLASGRGRSASSTRWLERQLTDPYVRRAKAEGYRARAAYKLIELDRRFGLLDHATRIVDLGAAPGSWCQVVRERQPAARLVGIDRLAMDPIPGAILLQGDFLDPNATGAIKQALGGPACLVLSDMAANSVGHAPTDHLRTLALVEAAAAFASEILRPGGAFVAKVLAGGTEATLLSDLKRQFASVKHAKPPASRKESRETYLVAQGFRGSRTG